MLYQGTMEKSYTLAFKEIANALFDGGHCLDCGANEGYSFDRINDYIKFDKSRYNGFEWNAESVNRAQLKGLNVFHGDLNRKLPFEDGQFRCVFGLSVLEHLLNGCAFMRECHRVLEKGGRLILLTPNISTYFTIALLLMGKMPSSGPNPDSNALLAKQEIYKVSDHNLIHDSESETPIHRHLVVFSYRVLRQYLTMIGFTEVHGYGFGLYPFPPFMQPLMERIDPYHCHQMVFVARKQSDDNDLRKVRP
jgi:SAM-dependent methyltransferase